MKTRTSQDSGRRTSAPYQYEGKRSCPYLWVIFFTMLALATVYLVEAFAIRRSRAGAASPGLPVPFNMKAGEGAPFDINGSEAASASPETALSPAGGYYDRDVRVEIRATDPGTGEQSDVIFTMDGSVPTLALGTTYTQPIRLSAATPAVTVVRARAVSPDGELGPVVSASYFVGVPSLFKKGHSDGASATLPMMSLIVDPDDLWGPERGIYANPTERGGAWERPVDVTYLDKDRRSGFHVPAGVRVHGGAWNRGLDKKSLRLYFRQEYGASRLEYPLFASGEVQSFKRLVLHAGGQDWHVFPHTKWTLMRNLLAGRLALDIGGTATQGQPALLFINGELWGIYQIRERIDRHFLMDRYGVESADILEGPEFSGGQGVIIGDREEWDELLDFVEMHDLADAANYAYVQTQVDVTGFIDYNILEIYAANTDWPLQNEYWFRPHVQGGRWRWIVWDADQGFGAYPSSVNVDLMDRVLDDDHPETGGRDTLLLRKLLENPAFFDQFLSRTADLLNTALAPSSVIAHIDALAAELEPGISYEAMRWTSSVNWQSSVEELRDFARHRPDFVRQHIVDSFGLSGTAEVAVNPPVSGSGAVAVNEYLVQDLPWQGVYFQGIPIQVTAAPAPGFRFAGWEPGELPQNPAITLTVSAPLTITPRFEAVGGASGEAEAPSLPFISRGDEVPRPGDVTFAGYRMGEDSHVTGDRLELVVRRLGGVDLRGWRVTDNDTKTATDEGSLVFTDDPAFARVPRGTVIRIIVPRAGEERAEDDLGTWDREMVLYAGNGNLDADLDPGFNLGPNDNLVLLAPGPSRAFGDDVGIAFEAEGEGVTPATFGVLVDGVWPDDKSR